MILPERLIEARTSAGLSLGQAARIAGLPREILITYENGKPPTPEHEQLLVDLYEVDSDWLRGHDRVIDPSEIRGIEKFSADDAAQIMRTLRRMRRR